MWAKRGNQPVIPTPGGRKGVKVIGVVEPASGQVLVDFVETLKAEDFQRFLEHVLAVFGGCGKIWIILDNARVHHAKVLKPFLDAVVGDLELIYLPPYSPDLNVIERLWRFMRKEVTHNEYYPTFDEFTDALIAFFDKCTGPTDVIRSLCAVT
jgi:transposase